MFESAPFHPNISNHGHSQNSKQKHSQAGVKLYDLESSKHMESAASDYDYPIYQEPLLKD